MFGLEHEREWGFGKARVLGVPNPKWSKTASRCRWNLKQRLHVGRSFSLNALQPQDRPWDRRSLLRLSWLGGELSAEGFSLPFRLSLLPLVRCPTHRLSSLLVWEHLHSEKYFKLIKQGFEQVLLSEYLSIHSTSVCRVPAMCQALNWTLGM